MPEAQGLTHTAVTPLDLVKCRRQVDSKLYKGNFQAVRTTPFFKISVKGRHVIFGT